jgi:hypothetical protein
MPGLLNKILRLILKNADTTTDIPAGYDKMVKNLRYYRNEISSYIYY